MNELEVATRRLAIAVVLQAVTDWKTLCRMIEDGRIIQNDGKLFRGPNARHIKRNKRGWKVGETIPPFSFAEIEHFIVNYSELFCDIPPETIMKDLRNMLAHSENRARAKYGKS